jgi:hypothetical protein
MAWLSFRPKVEVEGLPARNFWEISGRLAPSLCSRPSTPLFRAFFFFALNSLFRYNGRGGFLGKGDTFSLRFMELGRETEQKGDAREVLR